MAKIEIVAGASLGRAEVVDLYKSVGWGVYTADPDRLLRAATTVHWSDSLG